MGSRREAAIKTSRHFEMGEQANRLTNHSQRHPKWHESPKNSCRKPDSCVPKQTNPNTPSKMQVRPCSGSLEMGHEVEIRGLQQPGASAIGASAIGAVKRAKARAARLNAWTPRLPSGCPRKRWSQINLRERRSSESISEPPLSRQGAPAPCRAKALSSSLKRQAPNLPNRPALAKARLIKYLASN